MCIYTLSTRICIHYKCSIWVRKNVSHLIRIYRSEPGAFPVGMWRQPLQSTKWRVWRHTDTKLQNTNGKDGNTWLLLLRTQISWKRHKVTYNGTITLYCLSWGESRSNIPYLLLSLCVLAETKKKKKRRQKKWDTFTQRRKYFKIKLKNSNEPKKIYI